MGYYNHDAQYVQEFAIRITLEDSESNSEVSLRETIYSTRGSMEAIAEAARNIGEPYKGFVITDVTVEWAR